MERTIVMKKSSIAAMALALIASSALSLKADEATPKPIPSQMQTHLKLDVKDETKAVHFINTNNDPSVFTKTYVLKHADPYEIRPYIRDLVLAKRVTSLDTRVEAIKYEDGTGILIVSAEDYRFSKQDNGMGIDEIIAVLDMPELSSSSGSKYYFYFPKYWNATQLQDVMRRVGINQRDDLYELQGGRDQVKTDTGLNALFFYTPVYPIKSIQAMLKLYDTPMPEALINYTVYEIDYENDGQIGVDFQAWKNGPGADLFAVGSRWSNGWDYTTMSVSRKNYIETGYTKFINFSPKWNTKYLDFLVSRSKAAIVTSGQLSIQNNQEGVIQNVTRLASIGDGPQLSDKALLNEYQRLSKITWDNGAGLADANNNNYRINSVLDYSGNAITLLRADGTTVVGDAGNTITLDFMISRSTVNGVIYYYLSVDHNVDAYFFDVNGTNLGKEVRASAANLQRCTRTSTVGTNGAAVVYTYAWVDQTNWQTDRSYAIKRDFQRQSNIDAYGFQMSITPNVFENATQLDVYMSNTNLLGFRSNGAPRTSLSEFSTRVNVDNNGEKFVIGGLDKKAIVRSVSKVPWLGSIPVLGWAFSTEGETMKTSQLVSVIQCTPVLPTTKLGADITGKIKEVQNAIDNFGTKNKTFDENDYGFDQWLPDSEKTGLDPLP